MILKLTDKAAVAKEQLPAKHLLVSMMMSRVCKVCVWFCKLDCCRVARVVTVLLNMSRKFTQITAYDIVMAAFNQFSHII